MGGSPDTIHVTEKKKSRDAWNCVFRSAVLIDRQDDNEYLTREEIEKNFPVIENMSMDEFYDCGCGDDVLATETEKHTAIGESAR